MTVPSRFPARLLSGLSSSHSPRRQMQIIKAGAMARSCIVGMVLLRGASGSLFKAVRSIAQRFCIRLVGVVAIALSFSVLVSAQDAQMSEAKSGKIMGTVMDVNGDAVTTAT